jgi:hypothetical protein
MPQKDEKTFTRLQRTHPHPTGARAPHPAYRVVIFTAGLQIRCDVTGSIAQS